ncbi:hypothetical protein L195_g028394 [Trifolium pratense]|uniref:Uncharacterized protein n=1 Tax=Trifolium pratense TaxID=57577 RepID=A0A2K3L1U4_TRIPR|nr:hypothetical protein L195_g028394 [Trifolium pratense]
MVSVLGFFCDPVKQTQQPSPTGEHYPPPLSLLFLFHHASSLRFDTTTGFATHRRPPRRSEAMVDPNWRQAMVEETAALHSNNTWDIVSLPPDKTTVGC